MHSQLRVSGVTCNILGSSVSFRNYKRLPEENTMRVVRIESFLEQNKAKGGKGEWIPTASLLNDDRQGHGHHNSMCRS